jgi:hypothetical protein
MITNAASIGAPAGPAGTNDIRGIVPPMEIPNAWVWFWAAVIVLVVAAAVVAAVILWRRKNNAPVIIPQLPSHVRARQRLEEALGLIDQPEPFCVAVSSTIRLYLEERFDFRAPERTTEEFLLELQATDLLLPDQKQSLGEFLSVCDMVKFARYEPGRPELEALHQSAVRLIDETEPQPVSSEITLGQAGTPPIATGMTQ